ncbi:MAG: SLBB domain-containing protein [Bacteroidota bacterium]|jgi:protein involved in polysaccharide export with SLBB domain
MIKHMFLICRILLTTILLFFVAQTQAQSKRFDLEQLGSLRVDDISDDQVADLISQMNRKKMDINELEFVALQKKMSRDEFAKLKTRIQKVETTFKVTNSSSENEDNADEVQALSQEKNILNSLTAQKIFGAELFNNKALTFEPNLKIATPANYQLGPEDELFIDVYGFSEASYKLKISAEGNIRIPSVGIIQLNGLTIESARKKIITQLSAIYSGINSGETGVNVVLGNIRSIKVSLIGEVNMPGTYTLPSLASVFNALYASGGPSVNGSFRNIRIIRGGKAIATLDVYEFLMKGNSTGNVRLQDQDIIKISPYESRVELQGEVKRPGLYEVKKGETIKDVLAYAGGFTDYAYSNLIKVIRVTGKEKKVAEVSSELFGMFAPQTGDVYLIEKVIDRFENRVSIEGAVFRPGLYAFEKGLTLGQLIKKAEGLREDAFTERGILIRLKDDLSTEMISFNVKDVSNGKGDIALKREDKINISSKFDIREARKVTITGEVLRPGVYDFAEQMKVEDLIILAGGLKESADRSKIEIARKVKNQDVGKAGSEIAKIFRISLDELLNAGSASIALEPFDQISVYQLAGYTSSASVMLEGEIFSPGSYAISKNNERVSDIVKRAGGITASSYPQGAILIRKKKLSETELLVRKQKLDALLKQTRDSVRAKELITREFTDDVSVVGIDLQKILDKPGSKFDLIVSDGDILRVPNDLQTVKVSGEVLYPVRLRFESGKSLKAYVSGSGGFTQRALKRRTYVVYPNGTAKPTRRFLFVKFYPKVLSGSEIVVPPREERSKLTLSEALAVTSTLTTLALIIFTLSK